MNTTDEWGFTKDSYAFERYSYPDRYASYYYQLREIFRAEPTDVLEIGLGDGVVASYIKRNTPIKHTSLDIADDLGADVVGSVTKMPFKDGEFDLTYIFEVLEHLPFEDFDTALSELARVSRRKVLISVPHFGPPIRFSLKVPFLPEIRFAWKVPYPRKHEFNGRHYWELGTKGYSVSRIRECLTKHFILEREFIPFENQYHHFFILTPRKKSA